MGLGHPLRPPACWSFGLVYLRDWDCGIHILGEEILKEVCVCPAKDASVVGVELYGTICWWWEPAMVIIVGSLIFTGVSVEAIMAYVWGIAMEIT